MPSTEIFESYARRVENEMSPGKRKDPGTPKTKKCPACHSECDIKAVQCDSCGYEFPKQGGPQFKSCGDCGALNPVAATHCHSCGASFATSFVLSLDEALRTGAIVRGMELNEDEVTAGEALATPMRDQILHSGDSTLIRWYRMIPDECLARFVELAGQIKPDK